MTQEQFQLLTRLMRGRPESPANRAAFSVLVNGKTQADAARDEGAMPQTVADAVKRYRDADAAVRAAYSEADDRVALAQRLCDRLAQAGYIIYNGNAETGETVSDSSGPDFWFTWTQGRDVETGDTHQTFLDAAGDAMNHWFTNATIDVDGRL